MANPHPTVRNLWREPELQIIRDHYPTKGSAAVAAVLGRTPSSVKRMASVLGVRCEVGGELNRALSVLKSRGMDHSNQIREFLLTNDGMRLLDVYLGPDGVLTGPSRQSTERSHLLCLETRSRPATAGSSTR